MNLTLRKHDALEDHYYIRATFENATFETKVSYKNETVQKLLKKEQRMTTDPNALWHFQSHTYFHRIDR